MREPFAADDLHHFLALHAVRGLEAFGPGWYERAVRLPARPGRGPRRARPDRPPGYVACTFTLADARDLAPATERTRRLLDADCDPVAVDDGAGRGPAAGAAGRPPRPGCGCPGQLDGAELAVQTVLGQQVSLAAARTAAARLVGDARRPARPRGRPRGDPALPDAGDPRRSSTPRRCRCRARAAGRWSASPRPSTEGDVRLDRSADRAETRAALLALPGIGPWTADYVAMRALGDPDVFLPTDLGVRNAAARLGIDDAGPTQRDVATLALLRADAALVGGARRPEPARRGLDPAPHENGDIQ